MIGNTMLGLDFRNCSAIDSRRCVAVHQRLADGFCEVALLLRLRVHCKHSGQAERHRAGLERAPLDVDELEQRQEADVD